MSTEQQIMLNQSKEKYNKPMYYITEEDWDYHGGNLMYGSEWETHLGNTKLYKKYVNSIWAKSTSLMPRTTSDWFGESVTLGVISADTNNKKEYNYDTLVNASFINPCSDVDREYLDLQLLLCEETNIQRNIRNIQNFLDILHEVPGDVDLLITIKKSIPNYAGFTYIFLKHDMPASAVFNKIVGKDGWKMRKTSHKYGVEFIYYYQKINAIVLLGTIPSNVQNAAGFLLNMTNKKYYQYIREQKDKQKR